MMSQAEIHNVNRATSWIWGPIRIRCAFLALSYFCRLVLDALYVIDLCV